MTKIFIFQLKNDFWAVETWFLFNVIFYSRILNLLSFFSKAEEHLDDSVEKRKKFSIWMQILVNSSSNRAVTLYLSTTGFYIISSVMHAFWLVLTYDLLEDRRIDDVIVKTFFNSLLYKTSRFQVAVNRRTAIWNLFVKYTVNARLSLTGIFLMTFAFLLRRFRQSELSQLNIRRISLGAKLK